MTNSKRIFGLGCIVVGLLSMEAGCRSKAGPSVAELAEPDPEAAAEAEREQARRAAHQEAIETHGFEAAGSGNRFFAAELYRALSSGSPSNLIVSPVSLHGALATAYVGARGETASSPRACGFPEDRVEAGRRFHALEAEMGGVRSGPGARRGALRQEFLETGADRKRCRPRPAHGPRAS